MKKYVKQYFPSFVVNFLQKSKKKYWAKLSHNDLDKLAYIYSCDKWGTHYYTPHYQKHFQQFKNEKVNLLEIGVGGYNDPSLGGASLKMWKQYFKKGKIYGLDIFDKSGIEEKRIKTFKGSQTDLDFLDRVIESIGEVDIIIDDGSHINNDIITTFNHLFPILKHGGIYVIEDLQCSYWPWYGGDSSDLGKEGTAMNYFRNLIHGLNHKEFLLPGYEASYYDKHIISIHFYHNILFIYKGNNNEESNHLVANQLPKVSNE